MAPAARRLVGLRPRRRGGRPSSTLALYKRLLAARREHGFGSGSLVWEDAGPDAVAFRRGDVHVVANLGTAPIDLPADALVILQSQPFEGASIPVDTAVWYTTAIQA